MASINEILESQQGRYEWGKRDCFTTSRALIEYQLARRSGMLYPKWALSKESEARRYAEHVKGGVHKVYHSVLMKVKGVKCFKKKVSLEAGDIVCLAGRPSVGPHVWDTKLRGCILGFVDESITIRAWTPVGLDIVSGDYAIREVYRCRRPS